MNEGLGELRVSQTLFYFINYYSQRMKAQKGDHYDDRNERKNDLP